MAKNERPNIFDYHDYRPFLQELLKFLKETESLSMRAIAKQAGVSHGYFSLVLKKQRNCSEKLIKPLGRLARLTKKEKEYFKHLLQLCDSRKISERKQAFKKMQASQSYKNQNTQEPVTYEYLDHWLHVTFREFASRAPLKNDPRFIQKSLPFRVTLSEIRRSLEFTVDHQFLSISEDNHLVAADKDLSCVGGIYQLSLGNFHKQMLDLAKQGIDKFERSQRKQIGYTFSLAADDFIKVQDVLEEAKKKIKKIESQAKNSPDRVYHVNFSAFPLFEKETSG